jgi:hypothetical protein
MTTTPRSSRPLPWKTLRRRTVASRRGETSLRDGEKEMVEETEEERGDVPLVAGP